MKKNNLDTFIEIDTSAIEYNINNIKKLIANETKIMCVVKSDAYGHGITEVSKVLERIGVDYLAVGQPDEAICLRENNINLPILILGNTPPYYIKELINNSIDQTIFSLESLDRILESLENNGRIINVHIKIDTGMGRLGFQPTDSTIDIIKKIYDMKNIKIVGIYTHLSTAHRFDKAFAYEQFSIFSDFIKELNSHSIFIPYKHIVNSAGLIDLPHMHFNMVRPGILIYGLYPSKDINHKTIKLKTVMALKTKIIFLKDVPANTPIGYDMSFITKHQSTIATIPVGFADGYPRSASNKGRVLVRGQYASIVGNICMDKIMIDVSNVRNVHVGDEVVLIGSQGDNIISVDEIAEFSSTINTEILCRVGAKDPKIYI